MTVLKYLKRLWTSASFRLIWLPSWQVLTNSLNFEKYENITVGPWRTAGQGGHHCTDTLWIAGGLFDTCELEMAVTVSDVSDRRTRIRPGRWAAVIGPFIVRTGSTATSRAERTASMRPTQSAITTIVRASRRFEGPAWLRENGSLRCLRLLQTRHDCAEALLAGQSKT